MQVFIGIICAWLTFFLHMVFIHTIFTKRRGAYAEEAISKSLSKQTFLVSRQYRLERMDRAFIF